MLPNQDHAFRGHLVQTNSEGRFSRAVSAHCVPRRDRLVFRDGGRHRGERFLRFLSDYEVAAIPFGEHHWREALSAYRRYGRSRHPAALNFGDCIAYAVAKLAGEPLLFVGDDFTKTDLEQA